MTDSSSPAVVEQTEVGSYFVANYPPFSVWTPRRRRRREAHAGAATARPRPGTPLGLYLHIPFCRKRCHFCYFRVYTGKNAEEVDDYLDLLAREWELYAELPRDRRAGRSTSSTSAAARRRSCRPRSSTAWSSGSRRSTPWTSAEEITFECEPGTLTEAKLAAIREIGVTRLSLGVENFDDHILEINGRAHRSPEIGRAYAFARGARLPADQHRPDRRHARRDRRELARRASQRTLELEPDSVTIYQMELPFNTTISSDKLKGTGQLRARRSPTGRPSGAGSTRRSTRSSAPAITSAAPTPR